MLSKLYHSNDSKDSGTQSTPGGQRWLRHRAGENMSQQHMVHTVGKEDNDVKYVHTNQSEQAAIHRRENKLNITAWKVELQCDLSAPLQQRAAN